MGSVTTKGNNAKKTTKKAPKKTEEAIVYIGKNDKLPLVTTKDKQVMLLATPTPKKYIKKRKGRAGQVYDYVETNYVIGRLNATFFYNWNSEVIWQEIDKEAGQVIVKIRLTVKFADGETVTKEAFGGADIQRSKKTKKIIDLADCLKSAESDAIKKAASMLGIAWDVYAGIATGGKIEKPQVVDVEPEEDEGDEGFLGGIEGVMYEEEEEQEEEDDEEKKELVETIRIAVERVNSLDYKKFKEFLYKFQNSLNPPRRYVGKKFGNLSLRAGSKDDLWVLAKNIDKAIKRFIKEEGKNNEKNKES